VLSLQIHKTNKTRDKRGRPVQNWDWVQIGANIRVSITTRDGRTQLMVDAPLEIRVVRDTAKKEPAPCPLE
jgi:hypothetical protein